MDIEEAVDELDAIDDTVAVAQSKAVELLLSVVPLEVVEAYERMVKRSETKVQDAVDAALAKLYELSDDLLESAFVSNLVADLRKLKAQPDVEEYTIVDILDLIIDAAGV